MSFKTPVSLPRRGHFFHGSAVSTWLGFAVTFVARPFGGLVLGVVGDIFGRKVRTRGHSRGDQRMEQAERVAGCGWLNLNFKIYIKSKYLHLIFLLIEIVYICFRHSRCKITKILLISGILKPWAKRVATTALWLSWVPQFGIELMRVAPLMLIRWWLTQRFLESLQICSKAGLWCTSQRRYLFC